jgi:hypothetical protein
VRDQEPSPPRKQQDKLLPRWITPGLIEETKIAWNIEYGEDLTAADAVALLQNMGGLFEILFGEAAHDEAEPEEREAVRSACAR